MNGNVWERIRMIGGENCLSISFITEKTNLDKNCISETISSQMRSVFSLWTGKKKVLLKQSMQGTGEVKHWRTHRPDQTIQSWVSYRVDLTSKIKQCGAVKQHFAIFIPFISSQAGAWHLAGKKQGLYLLRRGLAGSCWGRSSSGPLPWRRCRPDWPGSCFHSRPPSSGQSSATCWASPPPSASPARLWRGEPRKDWGKWRWL